MLPVDRKPVSRSLRFQILRRDGYACRYCGQMAPDVKLHVDHVVPVALGGTDEPSNLTTACADCNQGKAATPADAETVQAVSEDAERWKRAMQRAREAQDAQAVENEQWHEAFRASWQRWTYTGGRNKGKPIALPNDWRNLVDRLLLIGADGKDFQYAIDATMGAKPNDEVAYLYSVARNRIQQRQVIARALIEAGEV